MSKSIDSNENEHFGIEEPHKAEHHQKSTEEATRSTRAMRWKCENNASIEDNEQFRLQKVQKNTIT